MEKKKLYRVDVVLYIMAENEFDASAAATTVKFDVFECSAERARFLDPMWEEAVPYNSDNDLTCKEIVGGKSQAVHPAELLN
jgi:hypothetical protein